MSRDTSAKAPPPACPLHDDAVPLPDFANEGIDPTDYLEGLRATYGPLAPIDFEDGGGLPGWSSTTPCWPPS